ncbi:MAG: hypothetical protein NBKEAIPA_03384 [Nitrospirae bacterium]|nr:MAG: hypothetical protein UZ03_NOB001002600 [Nitrospira sp. OLB3]MBV6471452.1 hypothetical protein [Nitrospirota bacterium]
MSVATTIKAQPFILPPMDDAPALNAHHLFRWVQILRSFDPL